MTKTPKQVLKMYLRAGWEKIRQKGSHITLKKGNKIESIPFHSRELGKGLESKLLKRLKEEN
jgi:predicted RNA binding protein YcfA (HicA-like mRNA interferase family)